MRDFFKDIFQYHLEMNQQLGDQLKTHQELISPRFAALFCHLFNAHHIWNARILHKPTLGVNDTHSWDQCMNLNQQNHRDTLSILEKTDLQSEITYKTSTGSLYKNAVREILFHINNHTTHHRGQIIMELRNKGIAPVMTDYIFYKR